MEKAVFPQPWLTNMGNAAHSRLKIKLDRNGKQRFVNSAHQLHRTEVLVSIRLRHIVTRFLAEEGRAFMPHERLDPRALVKYLQNANKSAKPSLLPGVGIRDSRDALEETYRPKTPSTTPTTPTTPAPIPAVFQLNLPC